MASKAILEAAVTHLNGFLPVYKPKNICCNKILTCLKYDLHFVLRSKDVQHGIVGVNYAKKIDFFADGLITFIIGSSNYRRRNFTFAEYEYQAKIEFGVERQFNTIDGKVLGTAETNHLHKRLVESSFQKFIGSMEQPRIPGYSKDESRFNLNPELSDVEAIYNTIQIERSSLSDKKKQKYPCARVPSVSSCHNIKLVDYSEPYATLNITCLKNFNVIQFTSDLARQLGTKASVVELTCLREGPMHLDDIRVLQLHELNLDCYVHRLDSYRSLYNRYLGKLDERFENDPTWRVIF